MEEGYTTQISHKEFKSSLSSCQVQVVLKWVGMGTPVRWKEVAIADLIETEEAVKNTIGT